MSCQRGARMSAFGGSFHVLRRHTRCHTQTTRSRSAAWRTACFRARRTQPAARLSHRWTARSLQCRVSPRLTDPRQAHDPAAPRESAMRQHPRELQAHMQLTACAHGLPARRLSRRASRCLLLARSVDDVRSWKIVPDHGAAPPHAPLRVNRSASPTCQCAPLADWALAWSACVRRLARRASGCLALARSVHGVRDMRWRRRFCRNPAQLSPGGPRRPPGGWLPRAGPSWSLLLRSLPGPARLPPACVEVGLKVGGVNIVPLTRPSSG